MVFDSGQGISATVAPETSFLSSRLKKVARPSFLEAAGLGARPLATYRDLALADVLRRVRTGDAIIPGPVMFIGSYRSFPCAAPYTPNSVVTSVFSS